MAFHELGRLVSPSSSHHEINDSTDRRIPTRRNELLLLFVLCCYRMSRVHIDDVTFLISLSTVDEIISMSRDCYLSVEVEEVVNFEALIFKISSVNKSTALLPTMTKEVKY